MISRKMVIKKLERDKKALENHLKHIKLYNFRNCIITILLKSGIALHYAFPFILAGIIIYNFRNLDHAYKKELDEEINTKKIEYMIDYFDVETEDISFVENLEYSFDCYTGWKINSDGFYERDIMSYEFNESFNLENVEVSNEELNKLFIIKNIRTEKKSRLQDDDCLKDIIIFKKNNEIELEPIYTYVIGNIVLVILIKTAQKLLIKQYPVDKIKKIQLKFKIINRNNIGEYEDLFNLKEENLKLLTEDSNNLSSEDKCKIKRIEM